MRLFNWSVLPCCRPQLRTRVSKALMRAVTRLPSLRSLLVEELFALADPDLRSLTLLAGQVRTGACWHPAENVLFKVSEGAILVETL